jgi:hypothetical protein
VCGEGVTKIERQAFPKEETMHDQEHLDKAKLNPASTFDQPMDIVEADDIAACEKLAILRAWEADERALQRAEDEGMGGGEHAHLYKVQRALTRLEEQVCSTTAKKSRNK